MNNDYCGTGRALLLAAIMMLAVFGLTAVFVGSAAADVTDVTADSADDVAVGQESVTQDVTFDVTIDGASSSETVTIDVSNALGDNDVDIASTDDVSLDSGDTGEVSVESVTDNAGGDGDDDGTIDVTLSDDTQDSTEHTVTVAATLTLNTAGVTTVDGISYTVEDGNDGSPSDSATFDLVPAEEITVTESNGNNINYAVSNVAQDGTVTVEPGTYSEEVTFDTSDVTLEGPNAGIDGDSARGDEATITGKVNIGDQSDTTLSGEVVIDGIEMATTDSGVTDGVVSVGDRQQKIENATIKNSIIDIDLSESSVGVGIYSEEVDNLKIENNAFTESGSGTSVAYNAAQSPVNTIEISENTLTNVDRLYNEAVGGTFIDGRGIDSTTVRIVDNDVNGANFAIGTGDSDDDLTTVDYVIRGNQIEASNVGIAQGGGTPASFTIENNDFTSGSSTKYIRDDGGILDLSAILNDQGNIFEQAVVIRDSNGDIRNDQISRTPIQSAVDKAESGDTILVTPGTYDESLSISTANIALKSTGGADTTTISYDGTGADPAVKINDDGVTLDGFTVERTNADTDAPAQAIYVNADPGSEPGVDGVTIEDNIVEGDNNAESAKNYGIYVDDEGGAVDGDGVTIDDNNVFGFSGGVQVSTGYGNELKNTDVTNNLIEDNTYGVVVSDFGDNSIDPDVDITNNDIKNSVQAGVIIPGEGDSLYSYDKYNIDLGKVDLNQNNIVSNSVSAAGNNALDATENWWGDASGPSGEGPGSGASVSANVDFEPWLDAQAPDGETVSPESLDVTLAETAIDADGQTSVESVEEVLSNGETGRDLTEQATFDSEDSTIASVSEGGTITAESPGSTTITAEADGLEGEVDVRVGLIEEIEVAVEDDRISVGESTGFTVDGTFTDGSVSEVTDNADLELELVTGEDRATIDADANEVTGDAQGAVTLEATLQGETDTAELDVFREETGDVQNNRVEFEEVESTRSIEFEEDVDDDTEVTVTEGTRPPEDAPEPPADVDPVVAPDYEVPEEATDVSATIELDVSEERLDEVGLDEDELESRLTALREEPDGDGYDPVTIVDIDTSGSGATVTIETPGFSTFILGGSSPASGGSGGDDGGGGGVGFSGSGGVSSVVGQATTISDVRPGAPGTTVTFDQTGLSALTFSNENAEGTVGVDRLDGVPGDAPPFSPSRPVAAVFSIDVPDEQADQSATLEFELDADAFGSAGLNPDEAIVLRALDEEYEQLDPDVEVDGDTVSVTVETPGFSTFVVTDDPSADTDADADADTPVPDDGGTPVPGDGTPAGDEATETPDAEATETPEPESLPGFGAGVAVVALLAAALLAARRRTDG